MQLPHFRLSVRCLLVAVAIFAGLTWAGIMARRARHYYGQAEIQARMEASYRREEHRLRSLPKGTFGAETAEAEAEHAKHHAALKDVYLRLATHPWEAAPPELPLPYPWNQGRDRAVLEAVLIDLMDPNNPDNIIDIPVKSGSRPEVVVGEMTYSCAGVSDSQRGEGEAGWNDLERRNSGGPVLIKGLGLERNNRVRYENLERLIDASVNARIDFREYFQKYYPKVCGYAWMTMPGYSRDGRMACVVVSGGFSPHGEKWAYELECTDDGWEVRRRGHRFGL